MSIISGTGDCGNAISEHISPRNVVAPRICFGHALETEDLSHVKTYNIIEWWDRMGWIPWIEPQKSIE